MAGDLFDKAKTALETTEEATWRQWCERANRLGVGIRHGMAGHVQVDHAALPRILDALEAQQALGRDHETWVLTAAQWREFQAALTPIWEDMPEQLHVQIVQSGGVYDRPYPAGSYVMRFGPAMAAKLRTVWEPPGGCVT